MQKERKGRNDGVNIYLYEKEFPKERKKERRVSLYHNHLLILPLLSPSFLPSFLVPLSP